MSFEELWVWNNEVSKAIFQCQQETGRQSAYPYFGSFLRIWTNRPRQIVPDRHSDQGGD